MPFGPRTAVISISVALWYGFFALFILTSVLSRLAIPDIWQRVGLYSCSIGVTIVTGTAILFILQRNWPSRWIAVIALASLALIMHGLIGATIYTVFPPYPGMMQIPFSVKFGQAMLYSMPIVSAACFAFSAYHYLRETLHKERQLQETERTAIAAQVATLQYQLNPHFLFNALNSVAALIGDERYKDAETSVLNLGLFLRRSIDADPNILILLKDELRIVEDYLAIERTRFGDRFTSSFDCPPQLSECRVPGFLLQPLVENVVKHAVSRVSRPVHVRIAASLEGEDLALTVVDDGPGVEHQEQVRTGIGLRNVEDRLHLIYGDEARLEQRNAEPSGLEVRLLIPAEGCHA